MWYLIWIIGTFLTCLFTIIISLIFEKIENPKENKD